MTNPIKRYAPVDTHDGVRMEKDAEGYWVPYSDLAAALAEVERLRQLVNKVSGESLEHAQQRNDAQAEAAAMLTDAEQLAKDIHYPRCWDLAAYPTLKDALHEMVTGVPCSTCAAIDQARGAV